ncbi:hypothetical protein QTP88_028626 [Uroleucon formosanum]
MSLEIMLSCYKLEIMSHQSQWYLNDIVINDYFKLITNRDPSIYCFDTFFLNKLSKSGYAGVKRWTRSVDIFSKTKIFFPIHIQSNQFCHWVVVCVDNAKKHITYYDSLRERAYERFLHVIAEYLNDEHMNKLGTPLQTDEWLLLVGENPCQKNGRDCGVFMCIFVEYISRNARFNFNQNHMLSFRQLIAYELTINKIINLNEEEPDIDEAIRRIINN